jgi:predicted thioesterase
MKNIFQQGEIRKYSRNVTRNDIAAFESGTVHEVYSTFALARDAEWSGRLFVLEMKEEDEEGIGTQINIKHRSVAFINDLILFESRFEHITERQEIITSFKAYCGDRLIAEGTQGQKILKKLKIGEMLDAQRKHS